MNKLILPILGLFFFIACTNEKKTETTAPPKAQAQVEHLNINRTEGDCEEENFERKCAKISLTYPSIKEGNERLKKAVANWANDFMVGLLDQSMEPDEETSLESAIQSFIEMHRETTQEMPDMMGYYTVEVTDTVLFQNEKYLTLRLDGYSFTGGAHPNSFASIATFDLQKGKLLKTGNLVSDLEALYVLAEKKFKEERAADFEDGFEFTESWPFQIADNVGITEEGLFFCYVPYEVTPYAMGYTEFVIPYDDLKDILIK
ncbi:MAG TPA: DUF3298/DUF4163 domain-containing protein [Bacteroidetes bacterium]|nr:DUF3298/DUF4163 domain-containing protein [Bacteroidota bacterium]